MSMPCIYLISTVRKNGEPVFYIGSSVDGEQRWASHRSRLRNDKHWNSYLQNLYNNGYDLHFEVLEEFEGLSITEIRAVEQLWIEAFKAISSKSFANVREACGGSSNSAKPVVLISPFGYIIHKQSTKEAERFLGLANGSVSRICRKEGHQTKGYQCFFKEDYHPDKVLKDPFSMKTKANQRNGLKRLVGFTGKFRNGEEFDIPNMSEFCRRHTLKRSTAQNLYGPFKLVHGSGLQLRRKTDLPYNWKCYTPPYQRQPRRDSMR